MSALLLNPGQKIGRWTLIERVIGQTSLGKRTVRWVCTCACSGTKHSVSEGTLRRQSNGTSKSCGCWRSARLKLAGQLAAVRLRYREYRKRSKALGIAFELTEEQFFDLIQQPCVYCDRPPNRLVGRRRSGQFIHQPIRVHGLDRKDPKGGYTIAESNIVTACRRCNSSKRDKTYEEFLQWRSARLETVIADLAMDGLITVVIHQ